MDRETKTHEENISPDEIIWRLAEVSAQLHHEEGNRAELLAERARLVEQAKQIGVLRPRSQCDASER